MSSEKTPRDKIRDAVYSTAEGNDIPTEMRAKATRILLSHCGAAIDTATGEPSIAFGFNHEMYYTSIKEAKDMIIRWADTVTAIEKAIEKKR